MLLDSGKVLDSAIDHRIDFHFNAMLDNVGSWRQKEGVQDTNLLGGWG